MILLNFQGDNKKPYFDVKSIKPNQNRPGLEQGQADGAVKGQPPQQQQQQQQENEQDQQQVVAPVIKKDDVSDVEKKFFSK